MPRADRRPACRLVAILADIVVVMWFAVLPVALVPLWQLKQLFVMPRA